jgi:proteasome lid subunit RPN8/RPN11
MSNNDHDHTQPAAYAAIITIRHPEVATAVTISVVLSPADEVTVEGQTQLVRDCTLAQLRAYAEAWETAVWETYEAITLEQLVEDEQVELEIRLADDSGESSPADWLHFVLILPPAPTAESITGEMATADALVAAPEEAAAEKPVQEEVAERAEGEEVKEEEDGEETAESGTQPIRQREAPDDTESDEIPQVIVSPSEPVYEEKEAGPEEAALTVPVLGPQPGRIAGQKRPLHDFTWAATDVFIEEPALRAAQAHALSSPTREVAGVLVGPRPEKQPDGRYRVHISDTIIAKHTVMQGASVTYTPESWRYMNDQLILRYPDETSIMVGWYHTHPGFGIFLSGMDLFIHQNFFTQIWHVALVLDPRARSAGFFGWDRQQTQVNRLDFQWPAWAEIW